MRYTLTDEEMLVVHQDQIDYNLREIERLKHELDRAVPDDVDHINVSKANKKSGVKQRLKIIEDAHAETVAKAKATEARVKKAKN